MNKINISTDQEERVVYKDCTLYIEPTVESICFDSCILENVNIISSNTDWISFISCVLNNVEIISREVHISTSTVLNSSFKGSGDFSRVQIWHSNILDSNFNFDSIEFQYSFICDGNLEVNNITLEQSNYKCSSILANQIVTIS